MWRLVKFKPSAAIPALWEAQAGLQFQVQYEQLSTYVTISFSDMMGLELQPHVKALLYGHIFEHYPVAVTLLEKANHF